ncbi:aspartic proteinase nepenthesin-1-like [Silene latifolia]|uniref:aspartic proteinase nepenthesin-1-like n=1 Tax=Silene latifolia TaxID=37657 RepID=UPI003D785542
MANVQLILIHITILTLISKVECLTMKMIPIDSPHLKILPENFNVQERHQYLINVSLSRANKFQLAPESFRVTIHGLDSSYYVTSLNIGEGQGALSTYLLLDTGSEQTWVQCEGCNPCFQLNGKTFAYKKSPNFAKMSLTDELCFPRSSYSGSCRFEATYRRSKAIGFLGRDTFFFKNSHTGEMEGYRGLAFGCALNNEGFSFGRNTGPQNVIAGIHGLAPGRRSFINQLDNQIKGRFSYCLPSWNEESPRTTTMFFGDDAQIRGDGTRQVQVISMQVKKRYHLNLNGISVDGNRLPIDPSIFNYDPVTFTKGFFIDSGAPYTTLPKIAHDLVVDAISKYFFKKYKWRSIFPPPTGSFQLCYKSYPRDERDFPSVVLHFARPQGSGEVDMVLGKDNMFKKTDRGVGFCMMVLPNNNEHANSLFGAFQQTNFNILFDISNGLLYFVPERCYEVQ